MKAAHLQEILEGWKNLIWESPEIEELAKKRMIECGTCDYSTPLRCMKCGCPLMAKIRSPKSNCPAGYW